MREHLLSNLIARISAYDPVDLLTSIAGLQLMPENADRAIRLEAFAHAIASLRFRPGKPRIHVNRLKQICSSEPLGSGLIAAAEDPFATPFTEAFTFFGGSFVIFPGGVEEATFILKHLSEALFLRNPPFSLSFLKKAHDLLETILLLSNEIARRAKLERGTEPVSAPGGNVFFPTTQRYYQLKRAVSFSRSELTDLFARKGIPFSAIYPLITHFGQVSLPHYQLGSGKLLTHPIVQHSNQFIIAIPGILVAAARHQLICLALENGVADELAKRYNLAVRNTVGETLGYLKHEQISLSLPQPSAIPCFQDAFFQFDTDKLAYVMLVTDSLVNYDRKEAFGLWSLDTLEAKFAERLHSVAENVLNLTPPPNETLFLILIQGVGRMGGLASNAVPVWAPMLGMTAADLQAIALLEMGERLSLWKYACAAERIRKSTAIASTGQLDEFHLYRTRRHSYYFSDEGPVDAISLVPGGAGELRREVQQKRDWHSAPAYLPGNFVEVTPFYDTRAIPLYVPTYLMGHSNQPFALLVEGLPLPIWIRETKNQNAEQQNLHHLYLAFADAIGYWLWQFASSLRPPLRPLAKKHARILIQLHLLAGKGWESKEALEKVSGEVPIDTTADPEVGTLSVILRPAVSLLLESANNRGERELMRHILRGLRELLPERERQTLSDAVIADILDRNAPPGLKKKVFFLNANATPDLDARGLPAFRKVQEADEEELLDELGTYLTSVQRLHVGPIPKPQRTDLLKGVVGFYYRELARLVASLKPDGLLEWLVSHHEALVHESAYHHLTMPTRLACFGETPGMIEELQKEIPERSKAGAASRFIIEYVVTRPPTGLRPMSFSVYDRLQALASQIVTFGFESDLIYYQLADMDLEMLPSGRLGTDRELYEKALNVYLASHATGEIARATKAFGRYWANKRIASEKPDLARELDTAALGEFGHTLTDLLTLMADLIAIGRELNPAVACLPLDDLIARLIGRLPWSANQVRDALNFLSLGARPDFLKPPQPYKDIDVFPWRFNRPLSYLRRPLLLRQKGQTVEAIWGFRHLYSAIEYLLYLCLSGRLQAQTDEMIRLMGKLCNEQGEVFNNQVADILEQIPGVKVQRRVKKIGQLTIATPRGKLGDIDVLVIDQGRLLLEVIECKDLALARTPYELQFELKNLFQGNNPIIVRHQRRVDWVRNHLADILKWAGVDDNNNWRVESLIVVDEELFTPYLQQSPVQIVAFQQLKEWVQHQIETASSPTIL